MGAFEVYCNGTVSESFIEYRLSTPKYNLDNGPILKP
jgi:hypothetical protein